MLVQQERGTYLSLSLVPSLVPRPHPPKEFFKGCGLGTRLPRSQTTLPAFCACCKKSVFFYNMRKKLGVKTGNGYLSLMLRMYSNTSHTVLLYSMHTRIEVQVHDSRVESLFVQSKLHSSYKLAWSHAHTHTQCTLNVSPPGHQPYPPLVAETVGRGGVWPGSHGGRWGWQGWAEGGGEGPEEQAHQTPGGQAGQVQSGVPRPQLLRWARGGLLMLQILCV